MSRVKKQKCRVFMSGLFVASSAHGVRYQEDNGNTDFKPACAVISRY